MTEAALALNARRRFLAVRTRTVSNMAAHTTMTAPTIPTVGGVHCLTGANRIQAWHARTRVVFTVPVHACRGASKPEYNHVIERLAATTARPRAPTRWGSRVSEGPDAPRPARR